MRAQEVQLERVVHHLAPVHQRLVVEPDVGNHLAIRRLELSGFTFGDEIDLPERRARLAFLTRAGFEATDGTR